MSILPDLGRVPPITVGTRMRIAREWRDLEQAHLAQLLGVSRQTISNYERGFTVPKKLVINAWAAACDVDVEWLKTGREQESDDGGPLGGEAEESFSKITVGSLAAHRAKRESLHRKLRLPAA